MNGERRKQFIAEAEELISEAETRLLDLTETQDPDTLNALFRAVHTLKGNAGVYGFTEIETISHRLEEVLDSLRLGRIAFNKTLLGTLQRGLDLLKKALTADVTKDEIESLLGEIEESIKKGPEDEGKDLLAGVPEEILRVLSEYEEHRLRENIKKGNYIYLKSVFYGYDEFEEGLKRTIESLKRQGEVISTLPEPGGMKEGRLSFRIVFATEKELEEREGIELVYRPERPTLGLPATIRSQTDILRVNLSKIDELVEETETVRLIAEALQSLWRELRGLFGYRQEIFDLYKLTSQLRRRASVLQDITLSLRMVPVMELFERLSQVARRYARGMDKKVRVQIEGSDTEIDKTVMEEIADPLMHVVRNVLDHGIEEPSERKRVGKSETGTIFFRARRKGPFVLIEIEDDGRGINRQRLRDRAIEMGIIKEDEVLSDKGLLSLVFVPGLTTKDKATKLSGRGVGMDVVKATVEGLGGHVEISSEEGRFTRFSIYIPATLSLARVVLVRLKDQYYGIPLDVVSFIQESEDALKWIEGSPVLVFNGDLIPVISLGQRFFGLSPEVKDSGVVVVKTRQGQRAILVDEIAGTERVLIRPFSGYLREVRVFSGAFESRGRVCLLLEMEAVNT